MGFKLIDRIKQIFEKDEFLPVEDAKEFLATIGIDIDSLNLPDISKTDYEKCFKNLKAKPYMDLSEMKVKVTGTYLVSPNDLYSRRNDFGNLLSETQNPPISRAIKIDTFGRVPQPELR